MAYWSDYSEVANSTNAVSTMVPMALIAALAGGGGAFGVRAVAPPRPDPWTASQAREVRKEILLELDRQVRLYTERLQLEVSQTEHRIRVDMPPAATRLRIEALEIQMRRLSSKHSEEWLPPSTHFAWIDERDGEQQ